MNRNEQLEARVAALRQEAPGRALVDALNELGNYLFSTHEAEALALVMEAEALAQRLEYGSGIGAARVTLGFMTLWRGDPAAALDQAAQLWQAHQEREGADRLRGAIQELFAAAYHRTGQVGNTLAHALLALDYYERGGEKDGMATVLNLIGICFGWLDDPRSATPYLEQALALHLELKDDRRVVMMWGNLAWNYLRGGRAERAYEAMLECEWAYEAYVARHGRPPYPDFAVYLAMIRSWTLEAAGELEAAWRTLEEGKAANRREDGELQTPSLQCGLLRVEGRLRGAEGDWVGAIRALQEGLALAEQHQILRDQAGFHEALALAHKQRGEFSQAYAHHLQFHEQDKELFSTRTAEEVATLRTTLETQAARRQADLLGVKQRELEALVQELEALHGQVKELSIRDSLTGLYNRRYLDEALGRLAGAARKSGGPFSVVMADIDNFKWINDRFRHRTGDSVLRVMARLTGEIVPEQGFVARYGGEEFAFVMPGVDEAEARVVAEQVCREVERFGWDGLAEGLTVTVSAGVASVACMDEGLHPEELLRQADEALYEAKRAGRNRVA